MRRRRLAFLGGRACAMADSSAATCIAIAARSASSTSAAASRSISCLVDIEGQSCAQGSIREGCRVEIRWLREANLLGSLAMCMQQHVNGVQSTLYALLR